MRVSLALRCLYLIQTQRNNAAGCFRWSLHPCRKYPRLCFPRLELNASQGWGSIEGNGCGAPFLIRWRILKYAQHPSQGPLPPSRSQDDATRSSTSRSLPEQGRTLCRRTIARLGCIGRHLADHRGRRYVRWLVVAAELTSRTGFPVLVTLLIPWRYYYGPRVFTPRELAILDAPTANSEAVLISVGGASPDLRLYCSACEADATGQASSRASPVKVSKSRPIPALPAAPHLGRRRQRCDSASQCMSVACRGMRSCSRARRASAKGRERRRLELSLPREPVRIACIKLYASPALLLLVTTATGSFCRRVEARVAPAVRSTTCLSTSV